MKGRIPPECEEQARGEKVVCAERGRKITFLKPATRTVVKWRIDGCAALRRSLGRNLKLCDYLVVDWRSEEHYVELKGRNVEHALEQLGSTVKALRQAATRFLAHCWVITSASPANTAKNLSRKAQFEKQFNVQLKIRTREHTHSLGEI